MKKAVFSLVLLLLLAACENYPYEGLLLYEQDDGKWVADTIEAYLIYQDSAFRGGMVVKDGEMVQIGLISGNLYSASMAFYPKSISDLKEDRTGYSESEMRELCLFEGTYVCKKDEFIFTVRYNNDFLPDDVTTITFLREELPAE